MTIRSAKGDFVRVPVRRTLMSTKTNEQGKREWDLAWGADELQVLQLVAGNALKQGIGHNGDLGCIDPKGKPATIDDILKAFDEDGGDLEAEIPADPISVERLEWEHIQKVLADNDHNVSATARALGMHRRTLQRKLQKRPVRK